MTSFCLKICWLLIAPIAIKNSCGLSEFKIFKGRHFIILRNPFIQYFLLLVTPTLSLEEYLTIGIKYPTDVSILQSATNWTRVADPLIPIDSNLKLKFTIFNDSSKIFGVTRRAAVIYVKNVQKLDEFAVGSVFRVNVAASRKGVLGAYIVEVSVQLKKAEKPICRNNMNKSLDNFCAKFKVFCIISNHTSSYVEYLQSQNLCESSCGVGSPDGRCKWYQRANRYSTCTSDLKTCSDSRCDSLELISFNHGGLVCPQDCVQRKNVVNSTLPDNYRGIESQKSSKVCSCDGQKKCICEIFTAMSIHGEEKDSVGFKTFKTNSETSVYSVTSEIIPTTTESTKDSSISLLTLESTSKISALGSMLEIFPTNKVYLLSDYVDEPTEDDGIKQPSSTTAPELSTLSPKYGRVSCGQTCYFWLLGILSSVILILILFIIIVGVLQHKMTANMSNDSHNVENLLLDS